MKPQVSAGSSGHGDGPQQVGWSRSRSGVWRSTTASCWNRFAIVETSSGYTVGDRDAGDTARFVTLAAAMAWAGIRVGERCVRRK